MHKVHIPQATIDWVVQRQGRLHAYEDLAPERTALVVVDMQNYFMQDGQLGCAPVARDIVPNVNRLAEAVRRTGGVVAWIQNAAPEESRRSWANLHQMYHAERRERRIAGLTAGSEGYALWSGLDVRDMDERVVKTRYSAFIEGSSDLAPRLRRRGVDTVLVTGVATNVCCESTARDAMMLGFRTIMLSDANATFTDAEHNATLATFMMFFGDVQTTDEVIGRLSQASGRSAAE
jgi:ureidoacrylate peracid hydrolase